MSERPRRLHGGWRRRRRIPRMRLPGPQILLARRQPLQPTDRKEQVMSSDLQSEVIRISKEEATSSHVDDLLKRQMSLRGEPGVTRDRGRKWYYRNWFLL